MTMHLGSVPAGIVLYIPFASYSAAGASVTLTGLAVTDIEIYKDGSTTQRASDAGYALLDTDGIDFDGITGLHGFSIDLADNTTSGFYAAGSQYWVVVSAVTIDSQTVNFIAATFRIVAAEATAGLPSVNTTHAAGTAWASGAITAAVLANASIDAATFASDTGLYSIRSGTAQAGASTTITLDASASAVDDFYNGTMILISSGTGAGQARQISDYVGSTKVASVPAWAVNPDNTSVFTIQPFPTIAGATAPTAAEVADAVWDEDATGHQTQGTFGQAIGDPGADTDSIWALANTNLNATVSSRASQTSLDTVDDFLDTEIADIRNRLPAALVSGRMDASVGAMAAGVVTATAVATDAIDADALAADALAEIKTQVVAALNTDTYAEPGQGTPGATVSLVTKIGFIYKAWRNRHTQTAAEYALYADDATTKDQEAVVSDNGTTFERGEVSTGA